MVGLNKESSNPDSDNEVDIPEYGQDPDADEPESNLIFSSKNSNSNSKK